MNKALADLVKISNVTGKDTTLVQGGGGNTSVKTPDARYMYIKASGTALKDMNEKRGWRRMRIEPVLSIIADESLARLDPATREPEVVNRLLLACDDDVTGGARPSVEAHLHASLDKVVIHLHPIMVAAYVNARNGKDRIAKLFSAEKLPPLWVPYTDPGFMLARKISRMVAAYQDHFGTRPAILFLEKHGLFVTAATAAAALKLVYKVIKLCSSAIKEPKPRRVSVSASEIQRCKLTIRKAVFDATGRRLPVSYLGAPGSVASFMARNDARKLLSTPALNPDELVYANGTAMWVEKPDVNAITRRLNSLVSRGRKPAAAYVVKGMGLFVAADKKTTPVIGEITTGSLFIRAAAARFGGVLTLTTREQDFINSWESEAFRKKMATGAGEGQLNNRIALVTGAGSGLGRSIALGLARAGAMVALADIDTKAAADTATLITKEMPQSTTMAVRCDVTAEAGVKDAFDALIADWGGLDILVNAAGIAPAYPLVDLPVDKWRLALEVNLTGYFLAARQAAGIMIAQGIGGSIINVSSKSGLDASKNNTPYNATKAGEIHMARGWALELGQYGIRVNSVAPGNVFEGSKIWNPEYIRTCAKKYGIKPEDVIPYYVNKTALKREIKGRDVADSVVFLCSDNARTITGQILVPDSGQVMVR